jgi:ABC-type nitrate/sulfonate/bicarbonate transport system substrate-binding protein
MTIRMRYLAGALALLAMAATRAGAGTVKVGELGIVADASFYIGIERGYFAKAGLEVTLQRFAGAAPTTLPLSTDQLQVAGGSMSAALFNAFGRGLPIRVVMARTRDMPGFSSDTLLLREDLRESVTRLADLKGRTVAINAPASALDYMVGKMVESDGIAFADVKTTYMPWPDMGAAFANKAIDAGAVVEPFPALYADRKLAFAFRRASQVLRNPPLEVSVILYSKEWIDRAPDDVRAFTRAYLQAARDYYDAMRGGPQRADVVEILTKYATLKTKAVYDRIEWSYMDPNAQISLASLDDQEKWYERRGQLEKPVNVAAMIDTRFLDDALGTLGRVEVK